MARLAGFQLETATGRTVSDCESEGSRELARWTFGGTDVQAAELPFVTSETEVRIEVEKYPSREMEFVDGSPRVVRTAEYWLTVTGTAGGRWDGSGPGLPLDVPSVFSNSATAKSGVYELFKRLQQGEVEAVEVATTSAAESAPSGSEVSGGDASVASEASTGEVSATRSGERTEALSWDEVDA